METNTATPRLKAILALSGALLLILLGGTLTGFAAGAVGSLCSLAILFPLAMGFAGGKLTAWAARLAKVSGKRRMLLLSALAAGVIYAAYHYAGYLSLQLQTYLALTGDPSYAGEEISFESARFVVEYALLQETGRMGFFGYLLYKAGQGLSIGRFYSQSRLELGPALTWAYWLLEFGVILSIAAVLGRMQKQSRRPACGSPYKGEKHLGGTLPANESLLLDLIGRGDLAGLGRLLVQDTGLPSLEVYLKRCEACQNSDAVLTVRRTAAGPMGSVQLTDVSRATLQPRESRLFLEQLSAGSD
jgi:hypothetical protein